MYKANNSFVSVLVHFRSFFEYTLHPNAGLARQFLADDITDLLQSYYLALRLFEMAEECLLQLW